MPPAPGRVSSTAWAVPLASTEKQPRGSAEWTARHQEPPTTTAPVSASHATRTVRPASTSPAARAPPVQPRNRCCSTTILALQAALQASSTNQPSSTARPALRQRLISSTTTPASHLARQGTSMSRSSATAPSATPPAKSALQRLRLLARSVGRKQPLSSSN